MKKYIININIERWLLLSNAKDIGVLYLIFALFSALFLEVIIQYIADNLFSNSVIAHDDLEFNSVIDFLQLLSLMPIITPIKLNPNYITGFTDAEGCFHISIVDKARSVTGSDVRARFQITLHSKDKELLEKIKNTFEVGKILNRGDNVYYYQVSNVKDLGVIINHFDKYPLLTQKRVDFEQFKLVVEKMINKEHLTSNGLKEIISIKQTIKSLKESYRGKGMDMSIERPLVESSSLDPFWLLGFVEGEGCFFVNVHKKSSHRLGEAVKLVLKITQDSRENEILTSLERYLGCGSNYKQSTSGTVKDFIVTKFSDITDKIIPFFDKYPLLGSKRKDFEDFKKVAELMKNKAHLTREGLLLIKEIKKGMNSGRESN